MKPVLPEINLAEYLIIKELIKKEIKKIEMGRGKTAIPVLYQVDLKSLEKKFHTLRTS